jgi:hypothetical protein
LILDAASWELEIAREEAAEWAGTKTKDESGLHCLIQPKIRFRVADTRDKRVEIGPTFVQAESTNTVDII